MDVLISTRLLGLYLGIKVLRPRVLFFLYHFVMEPFVCPLATEHFRVYEHLRPSPHVSGYF